MSSATAIDLSKVPFPSVIEILSFEAMFTEMATAVRDGIPGVIDPMPEFDETVESDPAVKVLQAAEGASAAISDLMAKMNSTDVITKFSKGFGVDLPAALAKSVAAGKTPLEAIAEITNKTLGGDLKKLPQLFGDKEAQNGVRSLIQNMEQFRAIRSSAMQAMGDVDQAFKIKSNEAAANVRDLQGSVSNLSLTVAAKLLPRLTPLVDKASVIIDRVVAWSNANPALSDSLIVGAASLAGMTLALGAGRIAFGTIIGPISKAIEAYRWLKEIGVIANIVKFAAPLLAGNFAVIGTAATAFGEAMAAAGAFLMANPIVLVIVAIVAALVIAVPWIIKNWDALKAGFAAFGASLAQSFAPVINGFNAFVSWITGIWEQIRAPVMAGIHLVLNAFLNFTPLGIMIRGIMPLINWLKSIDWGGLGKMMIQGIIDGILLMLGPLGVVFKKAAGAGIDAFKAKAEIHSPSRVFMGFGENISEGLRLGISRTMSMPMRQARMLAAGVAGAAAVSAGSPALAASQISPAGTAIRPAAYSPVSNAPAQPVVFQPGAIVINVPAGADAALIARLVGEEIERRLGQAAATKRSAYKDDDA